MRAEFRPNRRRPNPFPTDHLPYLVQDHEPALHLAIEVVAIVGAKGKKIGGVARVIE
jgi:hypothetical protein